MAQPSGVVPPSERGQLGPLGRVLQGCGPALSFPLAQSERVKLRPRVERPEVGLRLRPHFQLQNPSPRNRCRHRSRGIVREVAAWVPPRLAREWRHRCGRCAAWMPPRPVHPCRQSGAWMPPRECVDAAIRRPARPRDRRGEWRHRCRHGGRGCAGPVEPPGVALRRQSVARSARRRPGAWRTSSPPCRPDEPASHGAPDRAARGGGARPGRDSTQAVHPTARHRCTRRPCSGGARDPPARQACDRRTARGWPSRYGYSRR